MAALERIDHHRQRNSQRQSERGDEWRTLEHGQQVDEVADKRDGHIHHHPGPDVRRRRKLKLLDARIMQQRQHWPQSADVDRSNNAKHERHRDAVLRADARLEQHDVERVEKRREQSEHIAHGRIGRPALHRRALHHPRSRGGLSISKRDRRHAKRADAHSSEPRECEPVHAQRRSQREREEAAG
ncbi:hypothetical protein L1887_54219 [Cichorium endivia]|nr:hypothetical protein L1887_54219 [Cichorium endivia]